MADTTSTRSDNANSKRKAIAPAPTASASSERPIGLLAIVGINTAIGKTKLAAATAAFFESASVPVRLLRIETGERRGEFDASDLFIDVNRASEAANLVGGAAALLDEAWTEISATIGSGGVVIVDCGAGAQNLLLRAAALASLDDVIATLDASCSIIVVTTPDPECGRQAAQLVSEAREAMPGASVVLAVNHINANQQSASGTPAQSAFIRSIAGLKDVDRIGIPFAPGQAIDTFKAAPIAQVLQADPEALVRLSGAGVLASRSAHSQLAVWYKAVSDQLQRIYWR